MKTLNDYMAMSYRMEIIEDKDEGGFVVYGIINVFDIDDIRIDNRY